MDYTGRKIIKTLALIGHCLPILQYTLFDPLDPVKFVAGAKINTEYNFSPTLMASSIIRKPIYNSFSKGTRKSDSVLPHVRSDFPEYFKDGDPAIEELTINKYGKLTRKFIQD